MLIFCWYTYRVDCDHTVSHGTLLCARKAVHPPFLAACLTFLLLGSEKTYYNMFISATGPLGISLTAKVEQVYILSIDYKISEMKKEHGKFSD